MDMRCELVFDGKAVIGESLTWSAPEQALYWIDVKAPALFRLDPAAGTHQSWRLDADIGGFALCQDRTAIVALRTGLHRLDLVTGAQTLLAPAPFDQTLFRFNEGACDAQGRFWIGVMFDPAADADRPRQEGPLHVFEPGVGLRPVDDRSSLHNGMVWSADGTRMFLSHSFEQTIFTRSFDAASGRLGPRTLFAVVDEADGLPDGAALDAAGGYWCALHGGWALRRFHPDGSHDRDVALPVEQPTMCAFGGAGLEVLFVSSATDGLDPAALARQPHAGGVFALRPEIPGQPRPVFARSGTEHETPGTDRA